MSDRRGDDAFGVVLDEGTFYDALNRASPSTGQPGHIEHNERGHTLVNMGTMTSGGTAGTVGRGTRARRADPGPHALRSGKIF